MALMTDNRVRHLPVIDDGKLIGLISIGDLVKDIISEQKFIIDQLEHYIMGDRGRRRAPARPPPSGTMTPRRISVRCFVFKASVEKSPSVAWAHPSRDRPVRWPPAFRACWSG